MFREWEELGYDIRGFDLNVPQEYSALPVEHHSRSRDEWPDVEDIKRERIDHKFKVTLPDLEAWKQYMNELTEAKLRALGVSLVSPSALFATGPHTFGIKCSGNAAVPIYRTESCRCPHNEDEKIHAAVQSHQESPVQFAPQAPRFEGAVDKNLVLHHPRPHSRGHSLSQKYFGEDDMRAGSGKGGFNNLKPIQDDDKADRDDVDTNPSNLGTPVLPSFGDTSHERNFSTMSNPWQDVQSTSRRPSHSSKPSFSKLNVAAPEFKFNPTSSFQPGQFNFGSNTFQPAVFQGASSSNPPDSDHSNQLSPPAGPSRKINVNAPVFSPGSSEFSFSAAGAPTFRPNAPAFTPRSVAGSVTSPILSGSESGKMTSSIFGSIDLNMPEIMKPPKKSKAIPIVRPASRTSDKGEPAPAEDENGRIIDETRVKRFRGASADDDEGPRLLAEPGSSTHMEPKGAEEERPARDSGISSTILSDSTEGKDNTSLSEVSAEHDANAWTPFEFRSEAEVSAFNTARPFGDDGFMAHGHQKSLSASARPFIPGTNFMNDDDYNDKEDTPVPGYFERTDRPSDGEAEVSPVEEDQSVEDVPQESIERELSPIISPAEDEDLGVETFAAPSPPSTSPRSDQDERHGEPGEPTFEEIDAVMQLISENDNALGVKKTVDSPRWHQPSPTRPIAIAAITNESPKRNHPHFLRESMVSILRAMEEMKQQFSESLHLDFRAEDLRNVVEEAVESRLPTTPPQPVVVEGQDDLSEKFNELQARYADLEQRHRLEEAKASAEASRAAELERQLWRAETKVEAEIMNRSTHDQRFLDLEGRLSNQEAINEAEVQLRRAAEDRLSEVQRLLRISSEEEVRLREALEEKDERLKILDATHSKYTMRMALLEAAAENSQKEKLDLENRVNVAEVDVRDLRQESVRWRSEADRATQVSQRQSDDLYQAMEENKQLHRLIDTLGTQLNENERLRDDWRSKFLSLQQDMENAMRQITEENARRAKKEQTMLARQEVLDAKLQAESKTRERLETELERLEAGERQGMKAVNEAKRLEGLLGEMRTENHKLQQSAMRYQAEFQEARESGAREIQRTRESMQAQVEDANNQVNVVREELEDEISRLRTQLDQSKLDADTVRSRYDMVMEDAQQNKKGDIDEVRRKHQDEIEDMQARFERQLNNTVEDAQRAESNLLERLSISTSKCEHLQDRVTHLEEKLDISREAARAAAQAAKASGVVLPSVPAPVSAPVPEQHAATSQPQVPSQTTAVVRAMQLPEKISPQALRESIMVLQEQVQERELRIEELEQTVAKLDPESETKIAKRDDEIIWLRELLAVRHSDLQDIITALGRDDYDQDRVRDAAIRLKANLQMEQQERERAMNGGSAIKMPNIAASLRDAATPRVAQAVGPLAAAWGNWRKTALAHRAASSQVF
ncbi:putative myosin class ii heavy chain [Diaporthe ampelina]|uniref:Putative myosin class ii heavy chain n=1 Tax=Diaporthe ampelina TaxID=1214573 RepID=A0A0G2ID78_9PEZI|nr:putative myosin class ii heavy chain [Diaporthe ampelina]